MTGAIDRVAPTRRPAGPARGYQRWLELLFAHWPVPRELLRPLVPAALELDDFEGTCYVGIVPFRMEGVRPAWAPEALAFSFLETNVRTYVHVAGRDPGVFFFSLDAASRIAVRTARLVWNLPYFHARMSAEHRGARCDYRMHRTERPAAALDVSWERGEALGPSLPGSFEHFLLERYLLYVERGGRLWSGQVHHAPYPAHRPEVGDIEQTLLSAAGLGSGHGAPPVVHCSPGVEVEIFDLVAVAGI